MKDKVIVFIIMSIFSFVISLFLIDNIGNKENEPQKVSNLQENNKEIEEKVFNVTKTDYKISQYFPQNIKQIKLTNYLSNPNNPTVYIIDNYNEMKEFTDLFFQTNWEEDEAHYNEEWLKTEEAKRELNPHPSWKIDFIGDTTTTFNMIGLSMEKRATVIVDNGTANKRYLIFERIYREILAFTNRRYYLHKSDLKVPDRDKRCIAQTKAFEGMSEEKIQEIKKEFGYAHQKIERLLMGGVMTLKDSNSPYWRNYTEAGSYEEPYRPGTFVESDGGFSKILEKVRYFSSELENEIAKKDLEKVCDMLQDGMDNHNLERIFEAHEIIHDYDYWVFNVEPSFVTFEPADWKGTHTYFGKASIIVLNEM